MSYSDREQCYILGASGSSGTLHERWSKAPESRVLVQTQSLWLPPASGQRCTVAAALALPMPRYITTQPLSHAPCSIGTASEASKQKAIPATVRQAS